MTSQWVLMSSTTAEEDDFMFNYHNKNQHSTGEIDRYYQLMNYYGLMKDSNGKEKMIKKQPLILKKVSENTYKLFGNYHHCSNIQVPSDCPLNSKYLLLLGEFACPSYSSSPGLAKVFLEGKTIKFDGSNFGYVNIEFVA